MAKITVRFGSITFLFDKIGLATAFVWLLPSSNIWFIGAFFLFGALMKTRILVVCLVLAVVALGYQVFQYTQIAHQAQNPARPGQRFATHPGAPTEEEIEREEKRLEQKVQQDRAAAAAAAKNGQTK